MAQADGSIVIDTEINADGIKAGTREAEKAVRRMAESVEALGASARAALNRQADAFARLNNEFAAQERRVNELREQVAAYADQRIPTDEYREIQAQIEQATNQMNRLVERQERFIEQGGRVNSNRYAAMQYDINQLANTIRYAEGDLRDLEETGQAFTLGSQTEEAAAQMERLESAERRLADMGNRLRTSYRSISDRVNEYEEEVSQASRSTNHLRNAVNAIQKKFLKLGSELKKVFSSLLKISGKGIVGGLKKLSSSILGINKNVEKTTFSFGQMMKNALLMGAMFQAISIVSSSIKEGMQNLVQYSNATNNSISMLWSSLERLKNSFATAFAPILNVVAPILSSFIDMISRAVTYLGMFFAALTGQNTFTKAVGVQKDYAASLEDTASSASNSANAATDNADAVEQEAEAAEDYLSPLDDINKYTEENAKNTPGSIEGSMPGIGSNDGTVVDAPLFEEVPIKSSIKGLADKIKSLIQSEDFEGLGAFLAGEINKGLAKIKEVISWENVGPAITKFVTAFTTTFNSLVDNLDWDLLGRTIGEGINTIVNTAYLFITQIDWKNLGGKIAEGLNGLLDEVDFYKLGETIGYGIMIWPTIVLGFVQDLDWSLLGTKIAEGLNGAVSAIDLSLIAQALGEAISGIFQAAIDFSATFDWTALGENIYNGINTFFETVDWEKVGQGISDFLIGLLDTLIIALEGVDWSNVVEAIKETLVNIDWLGIVGRILELLSYALGVAVGALAKLIGDAIGNAAQAAQEFFAERIEECGGNVVNGIFMGIVDAIAGIGKWIHEHIFQPFIEGFKNVFGIHSPSTVMQEQGHFIIEGLLQGIVDLIGKVRNKFTEIKKLIVEKLTDAKNSALEIAEKMRDGFFNVLNKIRDKFSSIFNGLLDIVRTPINWIVEKINGLLSGVESAQHWIADALSFSIDLPWWVEDLTGYSSFGINVGYVNIPRIPYLASGAVIPPNKEFMAVLGDQKHGNNIEAPESLIRRIVREEAAGGGNKYEVALKVGRRELAKLVIDEAKLMRQQTGKNPFELA